MAWADIPATEGAQPPLIYTENWTTPRGDQERPNRPRVLPARWRDLAFWIAVRPGMVLWLLLSGCPSPGRGIGCAARGQPAGDPGRNAVVVARVAAWLGARFYLCSLRAELDLHNIQHLG